MERYFTALHMMLPYYYLSSLTSLDSPNDVNVPKKIIRTKRRRQKINKNYILFFILVDNRYIIILQCVSVDRLLRDSQSP